MGLSDLIPNKIPKKEPEKKPLIIIGYSHIDAPYPFFVTVIEKNNAEVVQRVRGSNQYTDECLLWRDLKRKSKLKLLRYGDIFTDAYEAMGKANDIIDKYKSVGGCWLNGDLYPVEPIESGVSVAHFEAFRDANNNINKELIKQLESMKKRQELNRRTKTKQGIDLYARTKPIEFDKTPRDGNPFG